MKCDKMGVGATSFTNCINQIVSLVFKSFSRNDIDLYFIFEFLLDSLGFCQHIIGSGNVGSCVSKISGTENVFGYSLLINKIRILGVETFGENSDVSNWFESFIFCIFVDANPFPFVISKLESL